MGQALALERFLIHKVMFVDSPRNASKVVGWSNRDLISEECRHLVTNYWSMYATAVLDALQLAYAVTNFKHFLINNTIIQTNIQ